MCRVDTPSHGTFRAPKGLNFVASADATLNEIAMTAAEVAGSAVGLVTILDETTQWVIARFGAAPDQTSRESAFCAWAVHNAEVMWIEDARRDERFQNNPLVQDEPNIRFYAGAPLSPEEGVRIGTVCVFDQQPRGYDPELAAQLEALATRASEHLRAGGTVST